MDLHVIHCPGHVQLEALLEASNECLSAVELPLLAVAGSRDPTDPNLFFWNLEALRPAQGFMYGYVPPESEELANIIRAAAKRGYLTPLLGGRRPTRAVVLLDGVPPTVNDAFGILAKDFRVYEHDVA